MVKIFKNLSRREWGLMTFSIVFIVLQVWLDLKMPDYMTEITKLVQTPGSAMSDIWFAGGKMVACALGSLVFSFIVGYFAANAATSLSARLRSKIYGKTMSFGMEEIGRFSTPSLITRTTNDITQIQTFVALGTQVLIKAPILAVWAIVKIAGQSWQWTAATGGAVAFLIMIICMIIFFAVPKSKKIQELTDNLSGVTRENITGIRVVRSFNAEDFQRAKFEKANDELTGANLFVNRIMGILTPANTFMTSALTLAIYWIGAYLINSAGMADRLGLFSDMVVFSAYALQVIMAFTMMTMIFVMLPRTAVSAGRINEVIETAPSLRDGKITEDSKEKSGEIEFRNVSFRYPGAAAYVLHDVSFTAHRGETVAFIGSTGSGKSTLVSLIPRLYDVTDGEVLVDGVNVRDYTQETLHRKIGYVAQNAVLFSGTVTSNVSYGDSKNGDVSQAIAIAQGAEFVEQMKDGVKARVSQSGKNLSGGQKQRLSIARAVYRNPEIYVFDDSFSALDFKTDRMLRRELNEKLSDSTKLIVAQRVGTIQNADRIVVLDQGAVVGSGTHHELLGTCEVYREIAYSQLSEEELKNA
jgi:ATP-binding cassette subfamily B protein